MESKTPGFEILENVLNELERLGSHSLPSLNHFLADKQLYVTKEDIKELRKFLKDKKYKLVRVQDYMIIKRGYRL